MNTLAPIYDATQNSIPEPTQRLAFTLWIGMYKLVYVSYGKKIGKWIEIKDLVWEITQLKLHTKLLHYVVCCVHLTTQDMYW